MQKFKIVENTEDDGSNRGHSRSELDYFLTPKPGNTVEDLISALENRDNYGNYLINTRNKREVEQAIVNHFGPTTPVIKKKLEKERGEPFPPKTRQAMEDLIKSFSSKPNILTYEKEGDKGLIFPKEKNHSQIATANILKTVMDNAGVKYKLEKYENLKEFSKTKSLKDLLN